MAYCNECGAYIPDGHSKCLACGFDEAAAAKKAAAETKQSAEAYDYKYEEPGRFDSDFLREQLEEQRRRQQENSRKWAETEQAQRRKTQHEQKKYYGSAGSATRSASTARSTDAKKYNVPTNFTGSKILSALSYFGILFVLPYLLCKDDGFALYHAKQGMILFIACIVAEIVGSIFGLGWIVSLARIYFIYKGVKTVLDGKKEPLPYIGTLL